MASKSAPSTAPPSVTLADDTITVGSFDFAESAAVAEVYSQGLEAAGYDVARAFSLGPREFVGPAMSRGLVELVPEYAGTAQHTLGAFMVQDIDATVAELRGKGVTFEDYDLPGLKTVNGIAELGGIRGAWFKDPEGNILSVVQLPAT